MILTQMTQLQQWRARAMLAKAQVRAERQDIDADRKHYVDMREASAGSVQGKAAPGRTSPA